MKKMKLDVEALDVQSFKVSAGEGNVGTVRGNMSDEYVSGCGPCPSARCPAEPSAATNCYSCYTYCPYTCTSV